MSSLEHRSIGAFINSRIEIALKRVHESPQFLEYIRKHGEDGLVVDKLLQRLKDDERVIISHYNEDEMTRENFELNEAYLQGLKDCIHALTFLGAFEEGGCFGE